MCGYVDNGGYCSLADIVSSGEQVQSDGVALISAAGTLFVVIRKKDWAVVDKDDGSEVHQRMCDTEASFNHSVV